LLQMYVDETGHYYRLSSTGPWTRMEEESKQDTMLDDLQNDWKNQTGVLIPKEKIILMLESAESISVSYPTMETIEKEAN